MSLIVSGCATCKQKRLKCDETKPGCLQCQKRNVECAGYQTNFKWKPFEETKSRSKPVATRKSPAATTFVTQQKIHTHQSLSTTSSRGRDGIGAGLQNPRTNASIEFNFSSTWPSGFVSDSFMTHHDRRSQHFSANSIPRDHAEPYVFTASTIGSSPADNDSAPSFSSYFPEIDYSPQGTERDQTANLSNMQPTSSSLPSRPRPSRHNTSSSNNHIADISSSRVLATAHNLLPLPALTSFTPGHTPAWNTPRAYSPTLSIASSPSSDDVSSHTGASSSEELIARFDQQTCSILSVIDGSNENPWRSVIRPMADDCPALYHAILSMAAFHGAHDNTALHTPGMAHMTKSIRLLASKLQDMPLNNAFATSLALSFSEGWDSATSNGIQHLRASSVMVKNILIKYRQDMESGQLTSEDAIRIKFLCNTFVYMDVVARLTSFQEVSEVDLEDILDTVNPPSQDQIEVDPLMGCAMTLFPLIGQVANLVQRVYKTESNSLTLVSTAMELKEQIERWQAPSAMVFERPEDPNCEVQHLIQTAEAYRYATLLYLHQAVPEIPSESAESLAKKVLFKLASVPLSSSALLIQIFPLFAASCEVTDPEDRSWVVQRWTAMTRRLRIGNIKSCWGVVQELWNRRDVAATEKANRVLRRNRARGYPGESLASSAVEIPLSLKRKVSSIDDANEKNVVYQGKNDNTKPNQRAQDRDSTSRSRGSDVGDIASKVQQMKQLGSIDSTSSRFSMSQNTSMGAGANEFSSSVAHGGPRRIPRPLNETSSNQLEYEFTVRGSLHWLGVMAEWRWEVFL